MRIKKGQSRIELPPHSDILQVRAAEKGATFPYLLVRMSWSEIERMRKQEPVPYKKPTYYAVKDGGIEIVSEARMPMTIIVRFLPKPEEI